MAKIIILLLFLSVLPVYSAGIGDKAPDFSLQKLGGGNFTLSDYAGKVVYIYWFGWG